jgi:hypothetical protein
LTVIAVSPRAAMRDPRAVFQRAAQCTDMTPKGEPQ